MSLSSDGYWLAEIDDRLDESTATSWEVDFVGDLMLRSEARRSMFVLTPRQREVLERIQEEKCHG